jgi:hypothetical protein
MKMPTYGKTDGDISSPVGKKVVDSLTRKTGNSLPVRHNEHPNFGAGGSNIKGPATDSIVPKGSIKGGFKQD